jgi:uncharacterized protein (PEP-CTERM system associated)
MVKPLRAPRLAPLAAAVLGVLASASSRADWSVRPGIELRETYTDNVALRPEPLAEAQFVTEINPSLRIVHKGRRLNFNADARYNYFVYSDKQANGTAQFHKQMSGSGSFEAIDDTLFVDATVFHGPRSISPFGQQLTDNRFANVNQAQITSWSIAPYMVRRFGNSANMMLRYTRDVVDTGDSGFGRSDGNTLLFNLSSGPAFNVMSWNLRLSRQDLDQNQTRSGPASPVLAREQDTSAQVALASLRYRVSGSFALTASAGYDKYDYSGLGGVTAGGSWSTGLAWMPSPRTSLEMSAGKRYIGSSKSLQDQLKRRRQQHPRDRPAASYLRYRRTARPHVPAEFPGR